MAAEMAAKITPDPHFCLEDANVALITSDHWAFCVHKSVLRRVSVVFQNMFEDCSPPDPKSSEELAKFNGLDVIEISESHDIIRSFFTIVYDQKPVAFTENYAALGKLMVFCNKYMIHSIMRQIVAFLKLKFPDDLANYAKRIQDSSLPVNDIIHITQAALEANLRSFVVVGLYSLAVNRETTTEHLTRLSRKLLVHYSYGLSKLSGIGFRSQFDAKFNAISFNPSNRCLSRQFGTKCRNSWQSFKDTNAVENSIGYLVVLLQRAEDFSPPGICDHCGDDFKFKFRGLVEYIWMSLPEVFAMGNNWEELKREEEERFKTT